jgi:hypothetical protein
VKLSNGQSSPDCGPQLCRHLQIFKFKENEPIKNRGKRHGRITSN